jgi:hypothetical protein
MSEIFFQDWLPLVEGQVYLTTVNGHITKEQARENDAYFSAILKRSTAPKVHLIIDGRRMLSIPMISESSQLQFLYHDRMGYILNIDMFPNPATRFVISTITSMMRICYQDVQTLSAACAFLVSRDPHLPPLDTWALPVFESSFKAAQSISSF